MINRHKLQYICLLQISIIYLISRFEWIFDKMLLFQYFMTFKKIITVTFEKITVILLVNSIGIFDVIWEYWRSHRLYLRLLDAYCNQWIVFTITGCVLQSMNFSENLRRHKRPQFYLAAIIDVLCFKFCW